MSSLRLQARLDQRMVLTPQLRQRIEMLQMTSIELNDLIQQEMVANPILEEVQPYEEEREISESIIDQHASGQPDESFNADYQSDNYAETFDLSNNGNGDGSHLDTEGYVNGKEEGFSEEFTPSEFGDDVDFERPSENRDPFEEVDFGREFQEYLDPGYKTQEIEYKEDAPSFEQFLTRPPSLTEHLEWQISLSDLPDDMHDAALCVIGNLDGDGRLTALVEELAMLEKLPVETMESARQFVLQLEPVGCGAKDVRECLIAQLKSKGEDDRLACMLIREHLTELQPHKLQHLSKLLELDLDVISEELKIIRTLDPYPGRKYSSDDAIYIAPEIYIEKIEDDYVIYFADDGSPRLRISQTYQNLLENGQASKEERDFVKEKMRSAVDLLRNIEHRRQTIYRVVECIVQRQREFLDKGVQFIKPMMLKDVAEDIGMHLSTISRVVNRKYAHTPQGVIELRRFFSEGMMNEDGEEVSTRIIKLRIKKLIEEEDTKSPITDDDIAKILVKEGIKLSRRTVAKYRDQMQIPGSRERKTVV